MKKSKTINKNLALEMGSSGLGYIVGTVVGGVVGGFVGTVLAPVVKDVLQRALSIEEKEKIVFVAENAIKQIQVKLNKGAIPTRRLSKKKARELFEGTLLKAKETYELKKLPLLANLFATAPFTNTPFENQNQTLIFAEHLSYQQLCILALLEESMVGRDVGLSNRPYSAEYKRKFDERTTGIYYDVAYMLQIGLIAQKFPDSETLRADLGGGLGSIVPNLLVFLGPGLLLYNGLRLDTINKKDLAIIKKALS